MGTNDPRMSAQTLKVLAALMSQSKAELSGAEIARSTKIASGTLYPILIRLESAGWVESWWETADPRELGRPRRRFYQVTGIGMKKARLAMRDVLGPLKELAWQ
jgi:PadR family transcriptional regulator PadR